MKATFRILLAVLPLLSVAPVSVAASSVPDGAAVAEQRFEKEVAACFRERIARGRLLSAPSRRFPWRRLSQERARVWALWRSALRSSEPLPLMPLSPLAEAKAGRWMLPDSLEPSAVMPYYFGKKGTSAPAAGYPFFLYLHGSGPKAGEWATGLRLCWAFADAPSVYFIPQIPREGEYYRWWQRAKQYAWRHLLWQVLASDSIDPARLYVFGISEGGYGSQRLAAFYADYWAAAGPMAGGEPLMNAPAENLAGVPFSLLTGALDAGFCRSRLTEEVRLRLDSLQQARPGYYEHRVELIPGRGHAIDYSPTTPWLREFERNARPPYLVWEDFEMDGRRREGFGCLRPLRRPAGGADGRTCYEMTLHDNCLDVTVSAVSYETLEADPQWGIPLRQRRALSPATGGRLRVYLDEAQVDFRRPLVVRVNGREVFRGRVRPDARHLVESCALFGDPLRLYAVAVDVTF